MEIQFSIEDNDVVEQMKNVLCVLEALKFVSQEVSQADLIHVRLLLAGLAIFTLRDSRILFDSNKDVDERAMVGCVYRYMYLAIALNLCEKPLPDIDIEYDRMKGDNAVLCQKAIEDCKDCETCAKFKSCYEFISSRSGKDQKYKSCGRNVRPDLIIHRRNSDIGKENWFVAEFKRTTARGREADSVKIQYFTCSKGVLKYSLGATVKLSKEMQNVWLYRDSEVVCHLTVSRNGVEWE